MTGKGVAVVIGFGFQKQLLPIIVSMGGAQGELTAGVHPMEIKFFEPQRENGLVLALKV